jgi:hypothetical protein
MVRQETPLVRPGKDSSLTVQILKGRARKIQKTLGKVVRIEKEHKRTHTHARTHACEGSNRLTALPLTTTPTRPKTTNLTNWHGIWLNGNMAGTGTSPRTERDPMTKSSKINNLVNLANELGLLVEIDDRSDTHTDAYIITIKRDFNGTNNLLEQMYSHESLVIVATRYSADDKPRAFKTNNSYRYLLGDSSPIKASHLAIRIRMMAEDLTRYNTKTAA